MEDKYYTPEIEEFHVGFEYEARIPKRKSFSKEVFYFNDSHKKLVNRVTIHEGDVRVKYLDREDIESLGFELRVIPLGEDTEKDKLGIFRKKTGAFEGTFFLDRTLYDCNIEFFNCYFMVKNKSELKRVLKMLNKN